MVKVVGFNAGYHLQSFLGGNHVSMAKQQINQFTLVQQSRQQVVRAYCPNMYTVVFRHNAVVVVVRVGSDTRHK